MRSGLYIFTYERYMINARAIALDATSAYITRIFCNSRDATCMILSNINSRVLLILVEQIPRRGTR